MRPLSRLIVPVSVTACAASSQVQVQVQGSDICQGNRLLHSSSVTGDRIDLATAQQHRIKPAATQADAGKSSSAWRYAGPRLPAALRGHASPALPRSAPKPSQSHVV